jgi:hypothetical protein
MEIWRKNAHQIEPGGQNKANTLIQEEVNQLALAQLEQGVELDVDSEAYQEREDNEDGIGKYETEEERDAFEMEYESEPEEKLGVLEPEFDERRERTEPRTTDGEQDLEGKMAGIVREDELQNLEERMDIDGPMVGEIVEAGDDEGDTEMDFLI